MRTELETIINPPQAVFEQFVTLASETEDWSFQLNDYNFWSSNFDQFWLVTVVEKGTSNLVASVSLARWDAPDGPLYSIGMFYCRQEYRGQGLGKPIFQKVMDIVGDANATLHGVIAMSQKYADEFGFDKYPDYWHCVSKILMTNVVIPEVVSQNFVTKSWREVDQEALNEYDATICSRDRRKIMKAWFNLADTFTRVVLTPSGTIVGYSTIRKVSKNRLSAAPFYANCPEAARVLLHDLLESIPNWKSSVSLAFLHTENNQEPIRLLENFAVNPEEVRSTRFVRGQFTKKLIETPDEKVYSISDCPHQFV